MAATFIYCAALSLLQASAITGVDNDIDLVPGVGYLRDDFGKPDGNQIEPDEWTPTIEDDSTSVSNDMPDCIDCGPDDLKQTAAATVERYDPGQGSGSGSGSGSPAVVGTPQPTTNDALPDDNPTAAPVGSDGDPQATDPTTDSLPDDPPPADADVTMAPATPTATMAVETPAGEKADEAAFAIAGPASSFVELDRADPWARETALESRQAQLEAQTDSDLRALEPLFHQKPASFVELSTTTPAPESHLRAHGKSRGTCPGMEGTCPDGNYNNCGQFFEATGPAVGQKCEWEGTTYDGRCAPNGSDCDLPN